MRLSTLEIKGFKSFGEKVVIHFDKGVTSIVGPNGSGKSNVVDAMRWVLGEQKTRMLRSEKMENIIFNGTKTRKPANLAEVSISFENTKNILPTEYTTVTVTRRLYRTGESEYLLNGVGCRLKDITDLFMDTGIGPDSYAIIELKMIDEILNDKNNAIKLLFEEAAGISKYKIRKKQTFSRLEETESDLNRVNDLLFEIERNMKTLESQAKKTERYYKIKEQYKELSTELALFTIAASRGVFSDLQEKEELQQNEKITAEVKCNEIEASLQEIKLTLIDKEKGLAEGQKSLNEQINNIRQYENDKKVSNEKLKFLQDKEASLTHQLTNDKSNLIKTQDELSKTEKDKLKEEELLEKLNFQLEELKLIVDETRLKHDSLKIEINSKTSESQAIQRQMHESEKSYAVTNARKESIGKELEKNRLELSQKREEYAGIDEKTQAAIQQKEQLEKTYGELIQAEEEVIKNITLTEEEYKKHTDAAMTDGRKLDAKQNEYNLIKSLVENLEGYPESLKYLKKNFSGAQQAPLFSDVINCRAEYKTAIENLLEPYMNYFVIDNAAAAGQAINVLSEASKGRANFFILDSLSQQQDVARIEIEGCIPAINIIEVNDKFKNLCNYLLRNVYIVTENQERTPTLNHENAAITFISQNGKYCKTKFALSGGSTGMFDGKRIGRIKNLEDLASEISALTTQTAQSKSMRDEAQGSLNTFRNHRNQISQDKNKLQQTLNAANREAAALQSKSEQLENAISKGVSTIEGYEEQLAAIEKVLAANNLSMQEQLQLFNSQYEAINAELGNLQHQFNHYADKLSTEGGLYNQQHIQCIQQQNRIATLIRDQHYKAGLEASLKKNIETNTIESQIIQEEIKALLQNSNQADDVLMEYYQQKEILEKNVTQLEQIYYSTRGEIDQLETQSRQWRHTKDQAEQLLNAIKEKTIDLKMQLNSLKERLNVEFNIDLNSIIDREPNPDLDEDELREKVNKQKSQLDNFGPINPMAVEAFNEINERYVFINTQKDDLARAKASLLQTIQEIDATAKDNFMNAFTQVRQNFINVFRSLFTEDDRCDLVLLDPENPTESDIQIIAQPKGKRPLSISQLSGGEKTLTATALLFGLYLLKPAPFCIFDEVDAPLDDANIDKFNNIIKTFSNDSQFIIITHNKRTMSFTDIIYGITMVEMGVTQVVPVDLSEVVEV